ncbi:MAG: tRNA pseudouridine(38-40) synthase TruA [Hadesarchaea archaeon]|nr:tRNA pseudouridine(38-40) synthase TruA [Hadesarchaea archaeon]
MRYAFLVAYDGTGYYGFTRQPNLPTIEGELLRSFRRFGLYHELPNARYRAAARTDRGASALGQVVALDVLRLPNISALNAILPPDIAILEAKEVDRSFDPRRHAMRKCYRYICEMPAGFDLEKAREAARLFEGKHDFKNFCKREKGRPTSTEIIKAHVNGDEILTLDFEARVFLWQQVRRLVNAILAVSTGELTMARLKEMLDGRVDSPVAPAPPEGLILMKVEYADVELRPNPILARKFAEHLKKRLVFHSRRAAVYKKLLGAIT